MFLLYLVWKSSFHTNFLLHRGPPGARALSWHLTNKRDGGRITTQVWNRSRSPLTIVDVAGSEIARFLSDTAVHYSIQSGFLIFYQSELLWTVWDNLQQIQAPGHQRPRLQLIPQFPFSQSLGDAMCCAGTVSLWLQESHDPSCKSWSVYLAVSWAIYHMQPAAIFLCSAYCSGKCLT